MKKFLSVATILIMVVAGIMAVNGQTDFSRERYRISINAQNQFVVDNGTLPIWINGVNTPWNNWNDFSGNNFDEAWWDNHFMHLAANGVNASRIWISCNNNQGRSNNYGQERIVFIDENGMVSGVSQQHWDHLDVLFEIAERHKIYIMATLISFDHFQYNEWSNAVPQRWHAMIQSPETIDSFVQHYTIPFVNRFKDNPFLWSIDIINEPDWMHEGQGLAWEDISHFLARNAAAIRANSDILVTVGMATSKYNSDSPGYEGNKVSDAFLQNLYPNPYAALDFWSPHYYDWVGEWYGHPFTRTPYGGRNNGGWELCPSKPAIIGEVGADGTLGRTATQQPSANWTFTLTGESFTLAQDYENAFDNNWQGVMGWTSNGVDAYGTLDPATATIIEVMDATRHMAALHPLLIRPLLPPNMYGDVNGDGIINAADATLLRRYIAADDKSLFLQEHPNFNRANADINRDGTIDLDDLALLRQYLAATSP